MKRNIIILSLLVTLSCNAEWRSCSEITDDLSSEDPFVRTAASGEFGLARHSGLEINIVARNENSESVSIQTRGVHYKVICKFSYYPRRYHHHWIIFLDDNREFLKEFEYPDCREYQWVPLTNREFHAIKYFLIEERHEEDKSTFK